MRKKRTEKKQKFFFTYFNSFIQLFNSRLFNIELKMTKNSIIC